MKRREKFKILRRDRDRAERSRLRAADEAVQEIIETRIAGRIRIVRHSGEIRHRDAKCLSDLLDFLNFRIVIAAKIMINV